MGFLPFFSFLSNSFFLLFWPGFGQGKCSILISNYFILSCWHITFPLLLRFSIYLIKSHLIIFIFLYLDFLLLILLCNHLHSLFYLILLLLIDFYPYWLFNLAKLLIYLLLFFFLLFCVIYSNFLQYIKVIIDPYFLVQFFDLKSVPLLLLLFVVFIGVGMYVLNYVL